MNLLFNILKKYHHQFVIGCSAPAYIASNADRFGVRGWTFMPCPQRPCAVGAQDLPKKNRLISKTLLYSILILLSLTTLANAKIGFKIELAKREIFIGESVKLVVKVNNHEEGMEPDLSEIKDCTVEFQGANSQSFQSITIVNGKKQVTGFSGRSFTYNITPEKIGSIHLGPITVKNKNDSTTAAGPTISVLGIEKQEYVLLSIEPSKQNVIVAEPFSVNLRILIKALPNPYRKASPIAFDRPPIVQIPYIKKDNFEGLKEPDIQKKLQEMVINNKQTPGFAINNFTFDSFFNTSLARFNFNPKEITKNGIIYFEYQFSLEYTPVSEGSFSFGPASLKGQIYTGANSAGRGISKSIYAIAEEIIVEVIPPPREGRPASYFGAIGTELTAKANLDSQTCKVGDPLTLTLTISGDIQMENIYAPALTLQDNLNKDFRIYDDSVRSETDNGQRIYKYTTRPATEGTLEFPPIELSYYNPESKTYETVFTAPIPIRANPATEFKESTVIDTSDQSITIMAAKYDPNISVVAPISMQPISSHQSSFVPKLHIPLLLLGPILLLISTILQASKKMMPKAAHQQRQRTAATNAIQRIHNILTPSIPPVSHAVVAQRGGGQQEITSALREYLSMRLDIKSASLTPTELSSALAKHQISIKTAKIFTDIIEYNFNASFQTTSQSSSEIKKAVADASEIIKTIETELPRKMQSTAHASVASYSITALLLFSYFTNTAYCSGSQNIEFESQLAMTQLLTANTPAQFDAAAKSIERVIDSGTRNAPLFYNYGTALLMAEQPQAALNAFIRSERYSGTTWDLKRNMLIATSKIDENITIPTLPWYRTPLFWHYGLSARIRTSIASTAFLMIWISILLRKTKFRKNHHIISAIAITLLIIFGSSAATTIYQEHSPKEFINTDFQQQNEVK